VKTTSYLFSPCRYDFLVEDNDSKQDVTSYVYVRMIDPSIANLAGCDFFPRLVAVSPFPAFTSSGTFFLHLSLSHLLHLLASK
jgi:hypothetical protein